jgi:hypothetical protein
MANSSERKQALVGWSYNNSCSFSNTQLQKFLFFYECFSKIDGDDYELEGLKGYKNGPVFSAVFVGLRYEERFKEICAEKLPLRISMINERRAKLSDFLVKILGNKLSEFTHGLNIWAAKREDIKNGERQVPLNEADFSQRDAAIFRDIKRAYPQEYIDSVDTRSINGKMFVLFKADAGRLTDAVMEALNEAAYDPEFDSPVYISFSETGELLLD